MACAPTRRAPRWRRRRSATTSSTPPWRPACGPRRGRSPGLLGTTRGMDGAAVDFALTRLEAVDGARLEVEGTWSGVRGVRFVRPALVVRGDAGDERTLLADLEHKPWPALDGETWVAAFPWTGGEPDVTNTELAVAPSIVVPLAGGRARREDPGAA